MGLMAIIDFASIEENVYLAYLSSAPQPIYSAASQVQVHGIQVINKLQQEIWEIQSQYLPGEEMDPADSERIEELCERIAEVTAGIVRGYEEADIQFDKVMSTPYEDFLVSSATSAFRTAFMQTIYELCPVRTGFLRSTCECSTNEGFIICVAGAEYAEYVEYGTSKMGAQPFFEPAVQAGLDAALPYLREIVSYAQTKASNDGRYGAAQVSYAASAESYDLSQAISGIVGFVMQLVAALIVALFEALFDMVFDIQVNYSIYII